MSMFELACRSHQHYEVIDQVENALIDLDVLALSSIASALLTDAGTLMEDTQILHGASRESERRLNSRIARIAQGVRLVKQNERMLSQLQNLARQRQNFGLGAVDSRAQSSQRTSLRLNQTLESIERSSVENAERERFLVTQLQSKFRQLKQSETW